MSLDIADIERILRNGGFVRWNRLSSSKARLFLGTKLNYFNSELCLAIYTASTLCCNTNCRRIRSIALKATFQKPSFQKDAHAHEVHSNSISQSLYTCLLHSKCLLLYPQTHTQTESIYPVHACEFYPKHYMGC